MTFFDSNRRAKKIFRQTGKAFCLDAVVQSLCVHYDLPIPAGSEIRRIAGTTSAGASVTGTKAALEAAGFFADAGTCQFQQLRQLTGPAVVIVNRNDGSLHYVIVNRARFGKVEVLDPAGGTIRLLKQKEFEAIWTRTILLVSPKPKSRFDLTTNPNPYRWIENKLWNHRYSVGAAILACLIQVGFVLMGLLLLRELLGSVRESAETLEVLGIIAGFSICAIFKALLHNIYEKIKCSIRKRLTLELEIQATEKIQEADTEYLEGTDCIELAKSCRADAARIGLHFASVCDAIIQASVVLALIAIAGMLDGFGWVFVFMLMAAILLPAISFFPLQTQFYLERKLADANNLVQKLLSETLAGIKPLRRHKAARNRKHEVERRQLHAYRIGEKLQQLKFSSQAVGLAAGGIVAASVLFLSYASSPTEPGIIISQFILANLIVFSLRKFSIAIAPWTELIYHLRRLQDLVLGAPQTARNESGDPDSSLKARRLNFQNIHQIGGTSTEPVFSNFTFQIKKGQSTQFVDESGIRNGYLSRWLFGQATMDIGSLKIDGLDIRDFSRSQLRKLCGICPAEPYIFQTELIRNIHPGNIELDQQRTSEIVTAVGLNELLDKLPQRLNTIIGKTGMYTTWEERYRIGLARIEVLRASVVIIELPKYKLSDSLLRTINHLLQTNWQDRIVFVLSNQFQPKIRCTTSQRFNRIGGGVDQLA